MKEERELALKKQKKADRGKATIFGWSINSMTIEMKILYPILLIVIIGAVFWFLYNKVAATKDLPKKDKKKK